MKLYKYEGLIVQITLKSGQVFSGVAEDYTSALDNTPPRESIFIRDNGMCFELYANDIATIEEIK